MVKFSSGAQKRKKLSNEEKLMAKVPKISTFMSSQRAPSLDSTQTTVTVIDATPSISNASGSRPISFVINVRLLTFQIFHNSIANL